MKLRAWALAVALLCSVAARAQEPMLRVEGEIPRPLALTAAEFKALPHQTLTINGREGASDYRGVLLSELLGRAGVPSGDALRGDELRKFLVVTGADGYRVVFTLAEFDSAFTNRVALLADERDGTPLAANAQPLQLVYEGEKRPTRWVRQLVSIVVTAAPPAR